MTLRELKAKVQKTEGKELPTAKALRESDIPIVAQAKTASSKIVVYASGFAIYISDSNETVLRIDECKDYTFRFDDGTVSYCGEDVFLDCDFQVLPILIGEDRIEHNRTERAVKNGIIQLEDGDWIDEFADPKLDFVVDIEIADLCRRAMSCLTAYQRELVTLYFFEGKSLLEIAAKYGILFQTVSKRIRESLKKMKNFC